MSWFIKFLECFLCFDDEQREVGRDWRQHEYQRLSSADTYSRTTPTLNSLRSQSNFAKTTTSSEIPNKWYENSVNSRSTQNRESICSNSVPSRNVVVKSCTMGMDPCNKVPVVPPFLLETPSATTKAKLSISDVPLKPNDTPSLSSSADVLQTVKANQVFREVTRQSSPNNVISAPSQRSQPSSDLPSYVHSFKPPSVTTKSTPSSVSEKSSQYAYKTKDLSSSSPSNCNVHKCIILNKAANKGTDHEVRFDECSAVSKSSQSSPKLPLSLDSSKLSSPVSHAEKRFPTVKKDPPLSTLKQPQSPKPPPLSTKPTLSPFLSSSTGQPKKNSYVWLEKSASTTYVFPMHIKSLIEKDIVPGVLKVPLSPATYKDYFHALLYAEDCHLEKWEGFEMKNVTLELHDATIYARKGNSKSYKAAVDKDEKVFLAFDIDKIIERQSPCNEKRERRPFLLSRDFVSVKPSGSKIMPFQGVIYRVVKSSLVLVEFGESFHSQHDSECEYDVNFSFNRVCLTRAHHAITAAPETLYRDFLFPDFASKQELPSTDLFVNCSYQKDAFVVRQILRLQGAPPYLVEGPISVVGRNNLSRTAVVIVEAVVRICRKSPSNRVLVCAPLNNTCDVLMRALKKKMKDSDMFRANAAFREVDGVPVDILPSCLYEEEMDCFACPSLGELKKYKVILSTFMSSFRLRDEGMMAGHFSHIFLVDASSVTEPEAVVPLANFANSKTIVVVSGAPRNHSGWVRSKIARENGLRTSYFERLRYSELYKNLDPRVITHLEDRQQNWNESSKALSSFLDLISLS